MTYPAFYTIDDAIDALDHVLKSTELTLIQRQVLGDLKEDLGRVVDVETFANVVDIANKAFGHP